MCNLYTYELARWGVRNLLEHRQLIGTNFPPTSDVYPNYEAPVLLERAGDRVIETMRWGFPPPAFVKSKAPVTNLRNVGKGYWRPYLGREHRCLVAATAFSEWDAATKAPVWFARPDGEPFSFAGIWRPWTGDRGTKAKPNVADHLLFSFLTTEPNAVVAPIHPKAMPVLLCDQAAEEQWLTGSDAEALELQAPAPDDAIVRLPSRQKAA